MLTKRVIPCLDLSDGRVVKGVRFQGLRDVGDPAERAALYERQGADEIVLLDVSATVRGRAASANTVARVRDAVSIPLTVGGGVRSAEDAARLLDSGADRVSVNSAAVESPGVIAEIAERFGAQCCVVAVDAARTSGNPASQSWEIRVRGGATPTGLDAVEWCARCAALGAGEVLLTSWDRDGTGDGYDLELLRAAASSAGIPVIASGGASGPEHMAAALDAGAAAVLAASIFHDNVTTVDSVKRRLASLGVRVRTERLS